MRESLHRLREAGDTTTFEGMDPDGPMPPMITPDRLIDCVIEAGAYLDRKMNAMKAHATQITVDGPFFALSNNNGSEIWGYEAYRLVKGTASPGPSGVETDLFAGL
jgi:N-acetyl-1-D-myo-inositol-2-amino-2-deoxy-alpha-D-glucopyranoside deacetylase